MARRRLFCAARQRMDGTAAGLARRNRPEINVGPLGCNRPLGLPIAHVVPVADDPRSRPQLAEPYRSQLPIDVRREEQRHHRRIADIPFEQVIVPHAAPIGDYALPLVRLPRAETCAPSTDPPPTPTHAPRG